MGQLEDILKHQNMVRNNIMKSFGAETSEDSLEKSFGDEVNPFEMEAYKSELTKAELDEFEKAKHQDGDMHPNGKWVWRASANGGKGDWRVAKPGGSKATDGGASTSTPSSGSTGTPNASSSYFSKLSNSLIEKYSKKKESVSLSDIEEFYEDFLRDRSQEPTRKVYANEAKKTYDAIVANWHKNDGSKSQQKQDDNTPAAKSTQTAQKQANKPSNDEAAKLTEKELEIAEDGSVIDFIYTDDEGNKEKEHYEKTNLQWYGRNANGTRVAVSESYLKVKISRRIQKDEIKVNLKMPKYASKQTDDSKQQSSGSENKLTLNGVDITVKRDPRDKYGYIVEGNGKSFKTQDPSFYNVKKPLGLVKKELAKQLDITLKTIAKKKTDDKKTYAAKEADVYDKGDGKVGNYPVPVHTSYPAANLYYRMKSNRHMSFKYGLPSDEIIKKLKDYKGNVKVSYHINNGTIEIYRIKFL